MNLQGSAPANDVKVVIEGSLMRLYFAYKKELPTSSSTSSSTIINGDLREESYSCENIDIDGGGRTYAEIIAAIVNDKYDNNAVQAIIANKALTDDTKNDITDTKRTEYLQEYNDFQIYRETAKTVATKAVAILEDLKKKENEGDAAASTTTTNSTSESTASTSSDSSTATDSSSSSSTSSSSASSTESK